jgi:diguanylate cyclase (GGDEF)-like protein/PAS domain S-box-containing protein
MNNLYSSIFNKLSLGLVLIDDKQNIVYWNKWIEKSTGIPVEYVLNKSIYDICPKFNKEIYKNILETALNKEHPRFLSSALHGILIAPKSLETDDVSIKQNIHIEPIRIEDKRFVLIQIIDVTSQQQRVHKLKNFIKDLETENDVIRQEEETARKLAMHDSLTGLPNRLLFMNNFAKATNNSTLNNDLLALLFIDLDAFKQINDTYGHEAGDKLLQNVAKRLLKNTRNSDMVARLSGDEFTIILNHINTKDNIVISAEKILNAFKEPFIINNNAVLISVSIGISICPKNGTNPEILLKNADAALYLVKNSGKNSLAFYPEDEDTLLK